jgi:hypothetical protein
LSAGLAADLARVLDRLQQVNPVHPLLFEYRMKLAYFQSDRGGVASAFARLLKVDRGQAKSPLLWMGAEAALQNGDRSLARTGYQRLLQAEADSPTTYSREARLRMAELDAGAQGSI